METAQKTTLEMKTLLLCPDVQFQGITRNVLNQLQVAPRIVNTSAAALAMIQQHEFDVIVIDWREIDNLAEFLRAVRGSKLNHECVLVAIVRDMLDLRQAFAAGVHFLIHKPASAVQIERCLRAAYAATVSRRRKHHRELVNIVATVSTRTQPFAEVTIVNVSESGVGLKLGYDADLGPITIEVGAEVDLRFALPTGERMHPTGRVMWAGRDSCGVKFSDIPREDREALDEWLTACVERELAELCERLRAVCA